MTTTAKKFEAIYDNNGSVRDIEAIQNILVEMTEGATRVVSGFAVTKWTRNTYEAGTWGTDNVYGLETMSEALASSTNVSKRNLDCGV